MRERWFIDNKGDLWDTEYPFWWKNKHNPVRKGYACHYREITNVRELKSTLRAGPYAWPGGYILALVATDGCLICWDCAKEEFYQICYSIRQRVNDGWRIIGCENVVDMDDETSLYCDHCNKLFKDM